MISEMFGIASDYIILALVIVTLLMLIMMIINMAQIAKLKKKYQCFMTGKDAKDLESTLIQRLEQVDTLVKTNQLNEENLKKLSKNMKFSFQKVGLVKYNAFNEMGGKLSFTLALLNEVGDGFVLNAVHSREGCYTYLKEVIEGNPIAVLCQEEKEALAMAMKSNE